MAVVGFDFGTTNSLISIVQGDRVISFNDEQGSPIPSVVCYEGSKTIVGREARERLSKAGLGVQGNVVRSPKTLLGRESVFVGGVERSPVDIVRDVVQFVRKFASQSRTIRDLSADRAVVTIPVNMEGRRRALLRDAFRMAGIGIVQFVHEPLAALYGYLRSSEDMAATLRLFDRQLVLVFDWGGGTLDLTLCRLVDGMLVQVGNDGTEDVGGDLFDEALRNEIERRARVARKLPDDIEVHADARSRLMHECEKAKIDLSGRSNVTIFVPTFFHGVDDPALDVTLSREDLEGIVFNLVKHGIARIESLLEREGYSTASVALCLATGGMVNMPIVKARLHELFGPQRVHVSERSASLISEGAAWVAHDDARLHLAKNVELSLARNSYMPLLCAGLEMPTEGEVRSDGFSIYCVDPTDGHGKFQLVSPHRAGPMVMADDKRRVLSNMVVNVDSKAAPFRERLQLDVEINDNLVLFAKAWSPIQKGQAQVEVHDLEFALSLPSGERGWKQATRMQDATDGGPAHGVGELVMRSNLAASENNALVPGEVLYRFDPTYFQQFRPPQIQVDERLYYEPCSYCRRVSNDPLCKCASSPATRTTQAIQPRAQQ
ncbi:Hsp70 family protein [Massilia glaciei]|uniref:Hsp70 family protein n=1 Tax=Massilia glaciei TaxID=1524097 RepID=A0A2U2HIZ2_9BURK|nr:Hsp70 family protein [Massilia glaciei]PWF46828.1 Hsp70 family protein [Massilia glaciei]